MSDYRVQIIHQRTGQVAKGWQPGDYVEAELIEDMCRRMKAKGVGVFKGEAKVLAAMREAWSELLYDLKVRV